MNRFNPTNYLPPWLLTSAIIFFTLILVFIIIDLSFEKIYQNKIYPGIFLGKNDLGGKTGNQARQSLNQQINNLNQTGISFYYKAKAAVIYPVVASVESDLAYQLINLDAEQALTDAVNYGRGDNFFVNLGDKIIALIFKRRLSLSVTVNRQQIDKILKDNFNQFELPAVDAKLIVIKQADNYEYSVTDDNIGKTIDYDLALSELVGQLNNLDLEPIGLATKTAYPAIYKNNCYGIGEKATAILNLAPINLKFAKLATISLKASLSL